MSILSGYKPSDLELEGYDEYRRDPVSNQEVQLDAIEFAAYCDKRFAGACLPTGTGKELIGVSVAKLTGLRTVFLTATKGLQEQYGRNHARNGLVDIRGRSNYTCDDHLTLDCRSGATVGCRLCHGGGCTYEQARNRARDSHLVVTNYAYWFTANDRASGIERMRDDREIKGANPVELLVLDEAHEAPGLLSDYLGVRVYEKEIKRWKGVKELGEEWKEWQEFIKDNDLLLKLGGEIEEIKKVFGKVGRGLQKEQADKLHQAEALREKLARIASMDETDTVIEKKEGTRWGRQWSFDVVWPGKYAEQYLFCGVEKVLLMSATLNKKTMGLLGVKKEDYEFKEWNRIFPAKRCPIYSIPAQNNEGKEVRIQYGTNGEDLTCWIEHIDTIIDTRTDRNGIIQTVSYERQRYLFDHSRHRDLFIGNTADANSQTAQDVADEFKRSPKPAILCSPSFATGWDFPKKECEYIIVCKVPFPPNQGKVQKARKERDPAYPAYQAMMQLVQSAGRGMRSADDQCEVFIVDGHVNWFVWQNKHLAPIWFSKAMRKVFEIPRPPEKLI
ncbi:MAG: hypothetical protein C5B54_10925 [Acidobacteria bacterium]|nr:MAG: hypothetical protein C5B54_10925 [Acidobacteriota bacterium]